MDLPVPSPRTDAFSLVVQTCLDRLLNTLTPELRAHGAEDRILTAVLSWSVRQTLARSDGNPGFLIDGMQQCLNEPDNEARIASYLQTYAGEPKPAVKVH